MQNLKEQESKGMVLGLVGVIIFSLTLPMTRIVVHDFPPLLSGLGRALLASIPAAILLWYKAERKPTWAQVKSLFLVSMGVVVAYPVFSTLAMKSVPASHGAIVNGLQPLSVVMYACWLSKERASKAFWLCALTGSALVVAYALQAGGGSLQAGDAWMLIAVAIGGLGYAEGARLAKQMGGWQVICWALVLSAPFLLLPVGWLAWDCYSTDPSSISMTSWLAFAYISFFSQFLGFFAWYAGLAMGGISRVSQVQLLQIFFTLAFSALFFNEHVQPIAWLYAAGVIAMVVVGRKAAIVVKAS